VFSGAFPGFKNQPGAINRLLLAENRANLFFGIHVAKPLVMFSHCNGVV